MTSLGKNIMLGTAGHVDHGKTALVKLLTGCDTDRLAAEKQRGLTIELGFAPCRMRDERIVGIVDVPGHVDFIRNMVAGAHGVDVVILVVAADDGVMPQTREHLDILTLMGVQGGLVALTKIDMVDAEQRRSAADGVRKYLGGTFLDNAPICPLSNVTGEGFDGFSAALDEAVAACRARETAGLFRLWIERVFTIAGFGTVLSGIPTSGQAQVGDKLRIVPGGQVGRVRGLEVYGRKADVGRAGQCVAVNLADIDYDALRRGEVLCHSEAFEPVRMVEAELQLLPGVRQPLKDYAEVHLHVGTAEAMANVAMLEAHPLLPGERQMVQLRVQEPLGIAPGDRFVIRAGMPGAAGGGVTTIGGGRVLGTSDRRLRRNRPWTLASLAARRDAIDSPRAWCELNLKEAAEAISAAALARRAQMPADRVEALLAELAGEGVALQAAARAFAHRDVVRDLAGGLADALAEYHAAHPDRAGMEESELQAGAGAGRALFDLALAKLAADGAIERRGPLVWRAGRSVKVSPEDREICGRIESTLQAAGLAAPRPAELAESLGVDPERLAAMIRLLADQGVLAELDPKVVLHRKAVEAAKQVAIDLFAKQGTFETVEFRDALGVSRKYAVPLLDYFDTIRLTVRSGSRRTPGAVAKDILAGKQTL